ncbi:MFS transporter [Natronobiforma cellulositropha]|uniref:MFS transporter n=1 Tax=Natronobiforma cellulositropha TaxID=1679076 RepID=UPI0021D57D35|nr:MFS transporter [Natronobiforma cellulositropha]
MVLTANDRAIARFTMLGHALVHWFETSIPIFLVVWLASFDVSVAVLGVVVALGYAPFGLGALPGGILADRVGPKRLILACLLGMSASFVGLALAGVADSIYAVAVALCCWGIAASVYHPAGLSLISTGVADRGTVFAYHGIAGNVGIALGPFVTATLLIVLEWHLVALVLALPGLLAVAYGLRATFDPMAETETEAGAGTLSLVSLLANSRALFASAFAVVFVIVTFEGLFYRGVLTYLPEILTDLPAVGDLTLASGLEGIDAAFYVYVGLLVVGMAGQYAGGKAIARIRPARGLAAIFTLLALLALAFVPVTALGLAATLAYCAVLGFFLFAIQPFYQEAVAVSTPPEGRGLSYGYTYLGEFGLGATSIALGGVVLGWSLTAFFAMLTGFALVGAALATALAVGVGPTRETARSSGETRE